MKPTALSFVRFTEPKMTEERRLARLGPISKRHGVFEKGTELPETQVFACPRVKVADLHAINPDFIPRKFIESREHDQRSRSCCRHPENHEFEARKSHPDEKAPDIYIFHCTCGRRHARFICARTDDIKRPIWSCDGFEEKPVPYVNGEEVRDAIWSAA